ncbi:uncharacterized protein LOC120263691 isoform X2 [Dioscorea cayenensis subsp. rotundata]|uniref:Uncharacterized protein LOC120263691 isoform X2 n=1 Tax=Dioscorea cayennensis subsp. rotundata TaxID=55577 RepID=A0AB40BJL5_DIOCR|nr:uncharacterized protein LOC120263691 isoform X2 [Dioscorea cayenensis subsp. rotundata]
MWGDGGRFYWASRGPAGIVVLFAWLSSQERNLKPYVDLYSSLGWGSLICHVDFLTLFLPEKAASLAHNLLSELVKEVKIKPLPIILASFSGGSKGCMYKVLQLIQGKCVGQPYQILRDCICGQIYDSSPVDFTSDLGTRFVLHPSVLKMSHPPRVVSWMAKAIASGLDTLFINRFEAQRVEYWQTLYSSVSAGPILIFCSENDELAPYQVVYNFAQSLQELGADVKLVKWNDSPHVAHYKNHQAEYKAALTEFLSKTITVYSQSSQLKRETTGTGHGRDDISKSVCHLQKAVGSSNRSLQRFAVGPNDHFYLPSSLEYHETKDAGSVPDEQKGGLFQMQNPPGINAHSVLGQMLFDVCVPKNIEGWDIKPSKSSNNIQTFGSSRRHSPFNPIKCIRRSKL